MDLIVGAPCWERAWILRQWVQSIRIAADEAGVEPYLLLLLDKHDNDSFVAVSNAAGAFDMPLAILWTQEATQDRRRRNWGIQRYHQMAALRNQLLETVRSEKPDYYLSLDTDILLHPHAIDSMLDALTKGGFHAVGGKCYMTVSGTHVPSYSNLVGAGGLQRENSDEVLTVDAIMAIKLMQPVAYAVDYQAHDFGEDIGWSIAAKDKGLRLGWDGRVTSKHMMDPNKLNTFDERVGF